MCIAELLTAECGRGKSGAIHSEGGESVSAIMPTDSAFPGLESWQAAGFG